MQIQVEKRISHASSKESIVRADKSLHHRTPPCERQYRWSFHHTLQEMTISCFIATNISEASLFLTKIGVVNEAATEEAMQKQKRKMSPMMISCSWYSHLTRQCRSIFDFISSQNSKVSKPK